MIEENDLEKLKDLPLDEGLAQYRKLMEKEKAQKKFKEEQIIAFQEYNRRLRERNTITVGYLVLVFVVVLFNLVIYGAFVPSTGEWVILSFGAIVAAYTWIRDWFDTNLKWF